MKRRQFIISGTAATIAAQWAPSLISSPASSAPLPLAQLSMIVSTSTVPGAVTPIFGVAFKKGDIATGTAPVFQTTGCLTQPYSWGCQSYWSDGSLKFASFMLSLPTVFSPGTQTISVFAGGTAPAPSTRTLTEVYAQLLQVNLNGLGASFGLAGTWPAWLKNDSNNVEQLVYLDGAAGKVWRVLTHFAQTAGGAAHGQLECYHYVAALTNASGNLGGFRHLARICQPWYNIDSPAKAWRGFSSVNWQYGAGPTTVPLVWPGSSVNFSVGSGSSSFTVTSGSVSVWDSGAAQNNAGMIPCWCPTPGASGVSSSTLLFMYELGSTFQLYSASDGTSGAISAAAAATGTVTPVPACLHFGSLFTATAGAKWNFFQGTGSQAADTNVQIKFDPTYLRNSGIIPPFDLTKIGSINDNATGAVQGSTTYDWNPVSIGPLRQDWGPEGADGQIGFTTWYAARQFYNQSLASEKLIRIIGLAAAHQCPLIRNQTTRSLLNVASGSYTGLPATVATTVRVWNVGLAGFTAPAVGGVNSFFKPVGTDHKPDMAGWAYLVTGEPQYLDMLTEHAVFDLLQLANGTGTFGRNQATPVAVTGVMAQQQARGLAWWFRDLSMACALGPATSPDGTGIYTMLRDLMAQQFVWWNAMLASSVIGTYPATNGFIIPVQIGANTGGTNLFNGGAINHNEWESGYWVMGAAHMAIANESAGAKTWLQNGIEKWWPHVLATLGATGFSPYYSNMYQHLADNTTLLQDDLHMGYGQTGGSFFQWTNSSPAFQIISGGDAPVPIANGMRVWWNDANPPSPGVVPPFSATGIYYVVNANPSTGTCDLAASPGGAAIIPTASGNNNSDHGWMAYPISNGSITSLDSDGYPASCFGAANWVTRATGTTALNAVRAAQAAQCAGISYTNNPVWLFT